jgi:hypothetical protein
MREYSEFLKLLSHYAVNARLNSGARALDASDFAEWLRECSEKARTSRDMEEFFDKVGR